MERIELEILAKKSAAEAIGMLNLERIIQDTCKAAVAEMLDMVGASKDIISQREAYKMHGEGLIKLLVREGKINRRVTGERNSKILYSRKEIELAKAILKNK